MAMLWAAAAVFVADQVSKWVIRTRVPDEAAIVLIRGFLNITYVRNTGGAFGIFPDRQYLFVALSVVTIAAILCFHRGYAPRGAGSRFAVGLIIGGALGNLADRLGFERGGCVTDWIDAHWGNLHWPAFNIADSAISGGVVLLLIMTLAAGPSKR